MKYKSRLLGSTLAAFRHASVAAFAAIVLLAAPVASNAQETTTAVRGVVTTPDGAPATSQSVTITDTRTGATRATTTNDSGAFSIRGLPVGGPYTILVRSSQYQDARVTDVYTNLSAAASFNISLGVTDDAIEEIVVTAQLVAVQQLAVGPGTAFSIDDIEAMPSIARQIRDVIRIDPRVSLARADNGAGSGINCLGGNSRSNAFTIDGAVANDGFGLNEGTGTSARFAFPVPYDTVASASVEFAPIDVQYGQFTGCAINIVTKPGSNEFHGSAFYLYNEKGLTGTTLNGRTVISDPFEDKNFGFDFSGPIIKDTLFFTVAYEETDEGGVQNSGPIGGGFANEDWLTVADANEIAGVLLNQYGRDVGPIVRTLPQTSERWFARFDWNINDDHRAEFTYTKLDELNLDPDDLGFGGFTFKDNFEFEGIDQETMSLRLFSNWTDKLSTEFRYSNFDVIDIQGPAGGGEAQDANPITRIEVGDFFTSGPGFFRSANDLQYTIDQVKLSADYVMGDHTLTVGFEQESRDIFNLFIPDATGTITFDDTAALIAGTANGIVMNGSFTQVAADAAAAFARDINSFYLQDEWQMNDVLTVIAGVRFDQYKSDDAPVANPVFQTRYGFTNTQTFDGLELVQPRLGLTWDLGDNKFGSTVLSAGYGVFGGGDPTVHFANAYQNFGGAIGFGADFLDPCDSGNNPEVLEVTDGPGGQFTGLPDCVRQAAADSANANTGAVAAVDPNFELPENHRWSIGLNHVMSSDNAWLDGWEIQADYIYTDHKNAVDWVDLRLTPNGVILPDGRLQFFEVDPTALGCNATFNGIRQGFSNAFDNIDPVTGINPCDDTRNQNQDILMTNGVEGSTTSFSLQFARDLEFSDRTSLNVGLGYAWLDAEVGNPVNSSTAGSSYEEVAKISINNNTLGPALWANEHNFVLRARLKHYWNDNNATSIAMFYQRRSGRPFSYAYEDDTVEEYFGDSDDESSILVYVPTGPSDPLMDFSNLSQGDIDDLFDFLDTTGLSAYAGGIAPKNAFNAPWSSDLDMRIQQDIGLWKEHQVQLFFDIENVLNLFSDDNNRRYTHTDDIQEAVRLFEINERSPAIDNTAQFEITRWYSEGTDLRQDVDDSVWRIQVGIRYKF